ncbi:unnamed protein product [Mytilus edulis]|uniref:Uncharacterized protein n=1 Tax=Mytilus edulis TaxID=6550 RepID=A0A8S3R372_MYTED|nr:unnamed protein product [Mytilus edulis]
MIFSLIEFKNLASKLWKDINLRCIIDNITVDIDSQMKVRQWTGRQNYDMLCMDGDCPDPNKYEMFTRNTSKDFDLLIHNFSESDLDYKYTCTCGFDSCTRKLFVEPNHVMSLPTMTKLMKDKNYINNDSMEIEIMLDKVNHVPNCTAWFESRFINDATVTAMKWYTNYNDVKVILMYLLLMSIVKVDQILCNLIYRYVTIFDEHIDICHVS